MSRWACFSSAAVFLAATSSAADETPSLFLDPAPAGDRGFVVERARVHGHLLVSARLLAEYARDPLALLNAAQDVDRVVEDQLEIHPLVSFAIFHRALFSVDLPFGAQYGGDVPVSGATAPRAGAAQFGDVRLGARVKLVGSAHDAVTRVDFAAAPVIWFPSASEGYAGDGAVRGGGNLIVAGDSPRLYWAASGGFRSRPAAELPGLVPTRVGHSVVAGMAAGFYPEPSRQLAVGTEATADFTVGGGARFLDPRATVAHFFLTSHWRVLGGPFELGAALGPGVGRGAGSADLRALFLFGYAPEEPEPPPDADDDGIPDVNDACVDLPGVKSRDPVLHGCPRPEIDRDGDAIPDRYDACPREPGEPTGDRRTHGCPVEEPEPQPAPKKPPKAEVVEQQIKISQRVEFAVNTAELLAESEGILREVARALEDHPDIELVEVQGHTDDTGTPERNRRLGQERAEAVVDWLAAHGVARERLVPKGYGTERPLADNTSVEGRAQNRRVEFHILRRTTPEGAP